MKVVTGSSSRNVGSIVPTFKSLMEEVIVPECSIRVIFLNYHRCRSVNVVFMLSVFYS